ncbi:MAG: hypothetical protein WBM23_08355 [Desulfomonilia bacterium]
MARWIIIALLLFPNIALGGVYVSGGVDPVEIGRRIAVSQGAWATGVTITSTPDGSTFNWATKEDGFNYNDKSGYSYSITTR